MDSLTLFGHLFKTPCEAICIFLDFFTEKRGSQREIYDFFRKSHETHCICKRFSIYCNKNCSGNMRILCPFAETTYTPPGDENHLSAHLPTQNGRNNLHPARGRKQNALNSFFIFLLKQLAPRQGTKTRHLAYNNTCYSEITYTPSGDENPFIRAHFRYAIEITYTPPGDENPKSPQLVSSITQKQLTPPSGDENTARMA